LLDALEKYEELPEATKKIRCFITGKGPEKERYLSLIESKQENWKKISVTALWLEADDYPTLLSICDLGVCLHYSSSGLDLPMKVVDMFGAGIPVLAIYFSALPELVRDGKTGFVFNSREALAARLL
jgi:beta-1,4-mannosyltransferase